MNSDSCSIFAGTVRLVEIVWLLLNDCKCEEARTVEIGKRHNFLESSSDSSDKSAPIAKTHLSYEFVKNLPEFSQTKLIVGFRNPKDILVSYYHFHKVNNNFGPYKGSWDEFFEAYKNDEIVYGCPIEWMAAWWQHRNDPNVIITKFEDFEQEGAEVNVRRIGEFLGVQDEGMIKEIAHEVGFDQMKQSSSRSYSDQLKEGASYLRKGKIGNWKTFFTPVQNEFIDRKYRELCLPIGLTLDFE